jgi:hypothetical protein
MRDFDQKLAGTFIRLGFRVFVPDEFDMPEALLCEGCDYPFVDTSLYMVKFSNEPEEVEVRYCDDCAMLAAQNYNGNTESIRKASDAG